MIIMFICILYFGVNNTGKTEQVSSGQLPKTLDVNYKLKIIWNHKIHCGPKHSTLASISL